MFDAPECRARSCLKGSEPCGKPVERELEHDGYVTFLCPTHRVVLRMLAKDDWEGDYRKVPCRIHAENKDGDPEPGKCRWRRMNAWGWQEGVA